MADLKAYIRILVVVHTMTCEIVLSTAIRFIGGNLAFLQTVRCDRGHELEEFVIVAWAWSVGAGGIKACDVRLTGSGISQSCQASVLVLCCT